MQSIILPLFESETLQSTDQHESTKKSDAIPEEKTISPFVQVLEHVTSRNIPINTELLQPLKKTLNDLFPEQQYEEKNIQEAKSILGSVAEEFTADELKDAVTEIQFLVNSWIDDFEREIFDGITLNELLHEKGGR